MFPALRPRPRRHHPRLLHGQRAGRTDAPRRDDFFASVWDEAVYKGKSYGIPCSADNRGLLYNADLLIRAGYIDAQGRAKPPRDIRRPVGRAVVHHHDLDLPGRLQVLQNAPQRRLQPDRVVSDGHDERDAWSHQRESPSVHSGFIADGSTLKRLYIAGMLVNISTTNTTVHTMR